VSDTADWKTIAMLIGAVALELVGGSVYFVRESWTLGAVIMVGALGLAFSAGAMLASDDQ
jgi:hypothetical protein